MSHTQKSAYTLSASVKDMDLKLGIVTGYAASFNTLDSDKDIIMPGAFTKTLTEQGPSSNQPRIKHLLNHNTSQPIAVPLVLKEDNIGLYYESKVGSHDLGVDFMKMVDSGLITEHSIGFGTIRKTIMNPDADWREQQTQLHELRLWEFSSLTAWGANQNTPLTGVKGLKTVEERIARLIPAIKNGTFTDSTFLLLEDELLFLQKAFKDLSNHSAEDDTTLRGAGRFTLPDAEVKSTIQQFIKSI